MHETPRARLSSITPDRLPLPPSVGPCTTSAVVCPPGPPDTKEPRPESLSYGYSLLSSLSAPDLAIATTTLVLDAHGLRKLIGPARNIVGELVGVACRFTPAGDGVQLALDYRDDALRIVAYDTHPPHRHPRIRAVCDSRRRGYLQLLPALVAGHGGDWGFGDAREPGGGTRTWAVLPGE